MRAIGGIEEGLVSAVANTLRMPCRKEMELLS